jgi:hypothetical protein
MPVIGPNRLKRKTPKFHCVEFFPSRFGTFEKILQGLTGLLPGT